MNLGMSLFRFSHRFAGSWAFLPAPCLLEWLEVLALAHVALQTQCTDMLSVPASRHRGEHLHKPESIDKSLGCASQGIRDPTVPPHKLHKGGGGLANNNAPEAGRAEALWGEENKPQRTSRKCCKRRPFIDLQAFGLRNVCDAKVPSHMSRCALGQATTCRRNSRKLWHFLSTARNMGHFQAGCLRKV